MPLIGLNNTVGVKINNIDISANVSNISLIRQFDELEVTAMGDSAHRFVKGLEASTLQLDFFSQEGASQVNGILATNWGSNITFALLQDKNSAVSATNPLYTGQILVNKTQDINGAVGDVAKQSITFTINGQVTYATTGTW